MRLVDMSDNQLLEQTGTIEGFDEDLNEEWEARHGMNIPYYLTGRDTMVIVNALTDTPVPDEMCDKLILEQAEELRIRRATETPDKFPLENKNTKVAKTIPEVEE